MKKIFSIIIAVNILASLTVYADHTQVVQKWNEQIFSKLDDVEKKEVMLLVRSVSKLFEQFAQAIDKNGESLLKAYMGLMVLYQQSTQVVVRRIDAYKERMLVIKAISMIPNIRDVEEIIQKMLPEQSKNEREVRRAINKALRNVQIKQQLKKLLTEKNDELKVYVEYIENNYAALIKELDDYLEEQLRDILKNKEE